MGISAAVLRAWEARYGLFAPARTASGYRLYGPEEERRARRMRAHLAHGVSAAESAALVLAESASTESELAEAWRALDIDAAQRGLDTLLDVPEPEVVAALTVVPLIARLPADRRHLARRMVETRLLAFGERWHEGEGRLVLVGCGPGEHDPLGAIVCALALRRRGWRIVYLGADTPVAAFEGAARALEPAAIVVNGDVALAATPVGDDPLATAASL